MTHSALERPHAADRPDGDRLAERRRLALESANVGWWHVDAATGAVSYDERFGAFFGLRPGGGRVDYAQAILAIHDDDRAAVERAVAAAVDPRDPRPYAIEYRTVHGDGSIRWVAATGRATFAGAGDGRHYTEFAGTITDITGRKRTEAALRASEARLAAIFDRAAVGLSELSLDGRFVHVNDELCRMLGRPRDALLGRAAADVTHADDVDATRRAFAAIVDAGGPATLDKRYVRPDGAVVWANSSLTRLDGDDGRPRAVLAVTVDLTERQQIAERRERLLVQERAARADAQAAMAMRDEFLAVVSHELRTPLASILIWTRLLEGGGVDAADLPAVLATIRRGAEAQRQVIDDLLDVSAMLAGTLRVNVRDVDLAPVLRAALETVGPAAAAKGITLASDLDPAAGPARADPDRLRQVLWNLIGNAVKFTDRGGQVRVALARDDAGVRITVADTGRGIAADFLPFVFDRFRQAEPTATRTQGGLGLGMAITKKLVELHGGTVRAESAGAGRGATFTVLLPAPRDAAPARAPRHATSARGEAGAAEKGGVPGEADALLAPVLAGVRVLFVEDDASTRTAVSWLLRRCGASVTAAETTDAAVAAFRAGGAYDAIVADIGLPGRDGCALLAELRAVERARGDARPVPALAMTAYAYPADRQRTLSAGFRLHLAKPVEPSDLIAAIAAIAADQPARENAVGA